MGCTWIYIPRNRLINAASVLVSEAFHSSRKKLLLF